MKSSAFKEKQLIVFDLLHQLYLKFIMILYHKKMGFIIYTIQQFFELIIHEFEEIFFLMMFYKLYLKDLKFLKKSPKYKELH